VEGKKLNISIIAKEIEKEIIAIRKTIHRFPELAYEEYKTAETIKNELLKLGIEIIVNENYTGVIGILKGEQEGKTLALRADMDALPIHEETELEYKSQNSGIMHACGHDIHVAVLLGVAKILSKLKSEIKGTVKFIFQPAEERKKGIPSGAETLILNNVLEEPKVDAIAGLHCWPELPYGTIGIKRGGMMASSDTLNIKIKGKGGHAAHPHKCIDPITICGYIITEVQSIVSREIAPFDSVVISFGKISGGHAPNVIPNEVELQGTMRTLNERTRNLIHQKIRDRVTMISRSYGGDAEIEIIKGSPSLTCDDNMINILENVINNQLTETEIVNLKNPSMGAEDFACYLQHVPGLFFRLGTANEDENSKIPLHNSKIIFDERAIYHGMCAMSTFALEYLEVNR
jgi:amidohydrolase/hippurate hydrolase